MTIASVSLPQVPGVELASAAVGLRKAGGDDVVLLRLAAGSRVAATFTRNAFCAAPVQVARAHLADAAPRALLINAGNANAGTGAAGLSAAQECCESVARALHVAPEQVLPFSTGVIFERLAHERITEAVPRLADALSCCQWDAAARAIMTTDTVPKGVSREIDIDGQRIVVTGMVKGAGMIRPNMATMLAFIATDACVAQTALDTLHRQAVDASFHCITVDSDTSTNDAAVLIASGAAKNSELSPAHPQWPVFAAAVREVQLGLAHALVRDAEGATKFIAIHVQGGRDREECRSVAFEVAHSPLVKTAFFAADPNLGRLLMAVGKAPLPEFDVAKIDLRLGDLTVLRAGEPAADYDETQAAVIMQRDEVSLCFDLHRGAAQASVWTCDFSYDYVRINAEYRS